jgi:hypothetical protein
MTDPKDQYCEAKTWTQARSGTWAGSHSSNGCQRKAIGLAKDDQGWTHHACRQHLHTPPANGWN